MIEKEIKTVEREFELGDLFIFRKQCGCYEVGDFLIIRTKGRKVRDNEFLFQTPDIVRGLCGQSSGGAAWLNAMLDEGDITYEGNLK
jgi:hypothetical protein